MSGKQPEADESQRWLEYAREDLEYGFLGCRRFPRSAAWSFQQAAEKAMKSMILRQEMQVPRSHDVAYIASLLESATLLPGEVAAAVLDLAEITPAGRYPDDDMMITETDAVRYGSSARIVVEWVESFSSH